MAKPNQKFANFKYEAKEITMLSDAVESGFISEDFSEQITDLLNADLGLGRKIPLFEPMRFHFNSKVAKSFEVEIFANGNGHHVKIYTPSGKLVYDGFGEFFDRLSNQAIQEIYCLVDGYVSIVQVLLKH
jgi:hypothetical protein